MVEILFWSVLQVVFLFNSEVNNCMLCLHKVCANVSNLRNFEDVLFLMVNQKYETWKIFLLIEIKNVSLL